MMGEAYIDAQSIVDKVRRLELHSSDYAVFGSGALVVRGIIPNAQDIDIICRGIALEMVRATGRETYLGDYGVSVFTFEDSIISCGASWAIGNPDIDKLIDEAEIIDGIPFVRLEHVVAYKKIRCSTKDVAHLRAIEKFRGQSLDP